MVGAPGYDVGTDTAAAVELSAHYFLSNFANVHSLSSVQFLGFGATIVSIERWFVRWLRVTASLPGGQGRSRYIRRPLEKYSDVAEAI